MAPMVSMNGSCHHFGGHQVDTKQPLGSYFYVMVIRFGARVTTKLSFWSTITMNGGNHLEGQQLP